MAKNTRTVYPTTAQIIAAAREKLTALGIDLGNITIGEGIEVHVTSDPQTTHKVTVCVADGVARFKVEATILVQVADACRPRQEAVDGDSISRQKAA